MFIPDRPITKEEDDFLGRKKFSRYLGKSLLDWKEKESLVIAIYGEWGSGKSSIINLATRYIEKNDSKNKPTIIEFNPWIFSDEDNLSKHFFNEIAKELEIRNDTERDRKIAKKLKFYSSLLNLAPEKTSLVKFFSTLLLFLGFAGISLSQLIDRTSISPESVSIILLLGGLALLLIGLLKNYIQKFADFFENKASYYSKSATEIKNEIKNELLERDKKLVIVVDDIDRLNQSEIRQIFKLIRANADFPNTIYLLAFEKRIIEKNLEEQAGISGKDYLNKIIQVNFDVPFANPSNIDTFLFKELDRILAILPESVEKFFEKDNPYWPNVYHSGFKNFFQNIRDVKRFASSLEFNISQMYQGKVLEVNPVDFIAIEAIRVFAQDFYLFMRDKETLFASTDRDNISRDNNPRKDEIEQALDKLPPDTKGHVRELLERLFPQIEGLFSYGYSTYGHEWQSTWNKDLRICSTKNYKTYFTLIPGGEENELSQFEIENILNKTNSVDKFEEKLREHIASGKIRKVLERLQDYTDDPERISQEDVKNVILALFNVSDDLPTERTGMFDFGADTDLIRITYQLLKRETDKEKNLQVLKEIIPASKSIYGPINEVSLQTPDEEKESKPEIFVIPQDKIIELQTACLEKLNNKSTDELLDNKNLLYILYRWKEWDKEEKWKEFIKDLSNDSSKLLKFIEKFASESKSITMGDYGYKTTKRFNYKSLGDFFSLDQIKSWLEKFKKQNNELYQKHKKTIDLFLDNFHKKDKKDWD